MEDLVLDRLGCTRVPILGGDVAPARIVLDVLLLEVQAEMDARVRATLSMERGVEATAGEWRAAGLQG